MSVPFTAIDSQQSSAQDASVQGEFCQYRGLRFYRIDHYDRMPRFFMSVVSAYDHWLFISSNGGLTAGRQNAEHALFPYYTEDKISDMAHCTGPLTLIREQDTLWQPMQPDALLNAPGKRALYKTAIGDQLFFSEEKHQLRFEYGWRFSDRYGLVRTASLTNLSDKPRQLSLLDGLQNLLPSNIASDQQNANSVLLDAYKSSECYDNNVASFALSSRLTDLAEPAESLTANSVWHHVKDGAFTATVSLDSDCPRAFVQGQTVSTEERVRGQRGNYFMQANVDLAPGQTVEWMMIAEVDQHASQIQSLRTLMKRDNVGELIERDIAQGHQQLLSHLAKSDGLQQSNDELTTVHHKANTLFNIMRGGFFEAGYELDRDDMIDFVRARQPSLARHSWWKSVPKTLQASALEAHIADCDSIDLRRLVREYLPISFSRRHGDPSRPWNRFSINLKNAAGESIKDYQGNWRDIFQNWEPLAYSYPAFLPSMISAFLNATSVDGYNPYRVTRQGIEWEEPEPDNAWSNIGYWSDHQIIYLSKLLELQAQMAPNWFDGALTEARFSYSNIPYRIKPFAELEQHPHDSIEFDYALNDEIAARVSTMGSDGKLVLAEDGSVVHATLTEKLLTLWLAKLSNFVPGGGLWMNTQRPEWNDANNALAGWGLSIVTVAYLHRHLCAVRDLLHDRSGSADVDTDVATWWQQTHATFKAMKVATGEDRYEVIQRLVTAADDYRAKQYRPTSPRRTTEVGFQQIVAFLNEVIPVLADTLNNNQRTDGLYHGYNVLHLNAQKAEIEYLPLMLEGQVAMLSSRLLSSEQALTLLTTLRNSALYRADQHTYLLYPNKQLDSFLEKNRIADAGVSQLDDCKAYLLAERVLQQSADGEYHFNVDLRNVTDLIQLLAPLELTEEQRQTLRDVYEQTFHHRSFTGRSGSFFAYEGLGSTYWHMVSKLLLAAQENWHLAIDVNSPAADGLADAYYDIRAGIGFNKTPSQYGAFPTDPYSHTPETGIARQPGMTGQVKEELITRLGEVGLRFHNGELIIQPGLLRADEFGQQAERFDYLDVAGHWQQLDLPAGALAFTLAQVPFVAHLAPAGSDIHLAVTQRDAPIAQIDSDRLPRESVMQLQQRQGQLQRVDLWLPIDKLRGDAQTSVK